MITYILLFILFFGMFEFIDRQTAKEVEDLEQKKSSNEVFFHRFIPEMFVLLEVKKKKKYTEYVLRSMETDKVSKYKEADFERCFTK